MNPYWLLLICPLCFFIGAFWGALAVLRHCHDYCKRQVEDIVKKERKRIIEDLLNEYHNAN